MESSVLHTYSEVLLEPGEPVEIRLGPGVYEVLGGDIDHSISLGSTTQAMRCELGGAQGHPHGRGGAGGGDWGR